MVQGGEVSSRMKRKAHEKELRKLQAQLCHLQEWVKERKLRAGPYAQVDEFKARTLVSYPLGRQAKGLAQLHRTFAEDDSLREVFGQPSAPAETIPQGRYNDQAPLRGISFVAERY